MAIERIEGGLSNDLFKVTFNNFTFFLKLFGTHSMCFLLDRYFEEDLMTRMNAINQSSKVIESDKKTYRIEEFIIDFRPLNKDEFNLELNPKFLTEVINILAQLNTVIPYEEAFKQYGTSKNSIEIMKILYQLAETRLSSYKIADFEEIMAKIKEVYFDNKFIPDYIPLVLSHNDVHCGNIMVNENDIYNMKIIDYEYANFNFIGFDIVNYFVECCIDLSYETYPFFQLKRPFSCLFEDELYFNTYMQYVDTIIKSLSLSEATLSYITTKKYFYKLLSLASTFWSLVGINTIEPDTDINKDSFNYRKYTLERLSVFEMYLLNIKK